jgi:hypothetical protein
MRHAMLFVCFSKVQITSVEGAAAASADIIMMPLCVPLLIFWQHEFAHSGRVSCTGFRV